MNKHTIRVLQRIRATMKFLFLRLKFRLQSQNSGKNVRTLRKSLNSNTLSQWPLSSYKFKIGLCFKLPSSVDNNWCTNDSDGWWVSFFLGFPHLQRENCLDLKKLQTIFTGLWSETATPWKQHRSNNSSCEFTTEYCLNCFKALWNDYCEITASTNMTGQRQLLN